MSTLMLSSTITCPVCGFQKQEPMPDNACVHLYAGGGFWDVMVVLGGHDADLPTS